MVWMNELWQQQNALSRQFYQLTGFTTGYPLPIMVTRLQKNLPIMVTRLQKKSTSGVHLAHSGFQLLSTSFLMYMCWFPSV